MELVRFALCALLAGPALLTASLNLQPKVGAESYLVGMINPSDIRTSYFEFDLPQVAGEVMSATLQLEGGTWFRSTAPPVRPFPNDTTFTLYGPPSAAAMKGPLDGLPVFGTWKVWNGNIPMVTGTNRLGQPTVYAHLHLNQDGMNTLQYMLGSTFRIGGAMGNFGNNVLEDYMFDYTFEPAALIVELSPVPEPSTVAFLATASTVLGLVLLRRRSSAAKAR